MLRVIIADDHELIRFGVREVINAHPGWEVCGEAADGREALEAARRERPDIAVIDVSLPLVSGLTVCRRLHDEMPQVSVLLLTMHDDRETIAAGLAAGARGYLLKQDAATQLETAISALAARRPFFSPAVSEVLLDAAIHGGERSQLEQFTLRELEVGQLIAEGRSNKEIARQIGRSVKTVESHRAAAMRKAGVRSGAEFVRFAIKHNLIQA